MIINLNNKILLQTINTKNISLILISCYLILLIYYFNILIYLITLLII